jgi:O-antigen ligase
MFLNLFLVAVWCDVCKVQLFVPALAAIQFQKIVILLALLGLLIDPKKFSSSSTLLKTTPGRALLFLVVWMTLSVPFSVWPGRSFAFVSESAWKSVLGLVMMIAYGSSEASFEKVIWVTLGAAAFLCGMVTMFPQSESLAIIKEEAYDRNELGFIFVLAMPFAYWKSRQHKGFLKIGLQLLCLLFIAGIVVTTSRGAFLGLLAVIVAAILSARGSSVKKLLAVFGTLIVLVAAVLVLGQGGYLDRVASITDTENNYNYTSKDGRIAVWQRGLGMMLENPFFGVGINAYEAADGAIVKVGKWSAAHNSLVQIGAELGVPGLLAYCIVVLGLLKYSITIASSVGERDEFYWYTGVAISCSIIGYLVNGFFLSMAYSNLAFLIFGIAFAFISLANEKNSTKIDTGPVFRLARRSGRIACQTQ